ncbi:GNAT superfamily N-acetyltransferase [Actinoplanes tereljensis]|uniref:N-acetyltransferase n=1 Tax=Paractinoplanes tereljensis TaxID=571912 RepID=A0A919NQ85_9ACTN|nr:GNAT family N-acetyltransferase [Actinoplanes tereljensis]GIF22673.1 N-acetyltransferase [Actinoplanes tereljensis]
MITVGPLTPGDRPAWESLFRGYNAFYGRVLEQADATRAWQEIQKDIVLHGLAATSDGRVVGIAHYLTHASTTSADVCYLQDLYTDPVARGQGVARVLIKAIEEWATARGCARLYWHTQHDNHVARNLYDKVAENRGFIQYVIPLTN